MTADPSSNGSSAAPGGEHKPPASGIARFLLRASLGQSLTTLWSVALGLFTAPYLILHLGAAIYGVFALINLFRSYVTNLEFGFGHATIRFLARARATGDTEEESAILGNALLIYLPATMVAAAVCVLGTPFIATNFAHGPAALHGLFLSAIRLGAFIIAISFLSTLATGSLQGLGKLRVLIHTNWISGTMLSASSVAIVASGGGLLDILRVQLVILAIRCIFLFVWLSRATAARLRPRFARSSFREMRHYAFFSFVAGVGSQILAQGPPAVLAGYASTAELAAFAVPRTLVGQIGTLVSSTSLGFLPFASAESTASDLTRVRAIFAANLRLTILLVAPVTAFLVAFADPLISTWIGAAFASQASGALRFLAISAFLMALVPAPSDLARGFGKPRFVAAFTFTAAAVTIALAFLLVPGHGATGAALARCLGACLTTVPYLFLSSYFAVDFHPLQLARVLRGPIGAVVFVAGANLLGAAIAATFLSAVVTGILGTCLYGVVVRYAVLDRRERDVVTSLWRRVRPRSVPTLKSDQDPSGVPVPPI